MRLGLFGNAAPRIARSLKADPQIEQRDLPSIMPPAWLVDKARAQGIDPMLEWQAMGGGAATATPATVAPMPSSVPPLGMFGSAAKKATQAAAIRPAMTSAASPQAAQPQIKGGMQMASMEQASRPQQLGAFGNSFAAKSGMQNAQPNFMEGMVGYDPNKSDMSSWDYFWQTPEGRAASKDRVAAADAAQAAQAKRQMQRDEVVRLFGPQAGIAFDTNPEKFGEYVGSNYQAANVGAGDSRVFGNGRETFTAPKFGVDGGYGYTQTPNGIDWQDRRGQSYAEATDEATLAETGRSNRAKEGIDRDRLGFDRTKFDFERTQPKGPEFGDENSLRSQYLGQVKTFQDIARAASSVRSLSLDMNPAEQMALIFQTMKMLDPGSTVREGEYANAQNTTGVFGQMWNAYNKAKSGEFLDEKQISDFRGMIDSLYNSSEDSYAKTYDFYRGMAPRYNMDPSIIQDFRLSPSSEPVGSGAARAGQALFASALSPDEQAELEALRRELGR